MNNAISQVRSEINQVKFDCNRDLLEERKRRRHELNIVYNEIASQRSAVPLLISTAAIALSLIALALHSV
jgi:hypothetical protein